MNIKAKVVNPLLLLVTSVLFLGLGIFILIDHDLASRVLMIGIAIAIVVAGITHAVGVILNKHIMQGVLIGLAYAVVAASLFVLSWFYIISVTWIFALWFLCTGIIRGAICIQAIKKKISRSPDWCISFYFIHCVCHYFVYESVYEKHNCFANCRHLYDFIWSDRSV